MSETLDILVTGGTEVIEINTLGTEVVEIITDSELVVITDSGLKGDQGQNASLLLLEIEVEEEIPGPGWPIARNRATGKGRLARADSYPLSFVIGFSKGYCAVGFVVELERYAMELTDWTAITGTQYLAPLPYFLGKEGGLSVTPDFSATAISALGTGLSQTVFEINLTTPIL